MTSTIGDTETKQGEALWAGFRYQLPWQGKIGYEYNRGSRYWFSFLFGASEMTNKLIARGEAHEIYYTHDFNRYTYVQIGMLDIDYEYGNSGMHVGTPMKVAGDGNQVDTLRNAYLLFGLNF